MRYILWSGTCKPASNKGCSRRLTTRRYNCVSCIADHKGTEEAIKEWGKITKTASASVDMADDDKDGCRDTLQHFGFDVIRSFKIGNVFFSMMAAYLKFEFPIPLRLTIPESNGPKCGRSSNYNMCLSKDRFQASYSIALDVNVLFAYKFRNLGDLVKANHLNKFTEHCAAEIRRDQLIPIHLISTICRMPRSR